MYDESKVSKNQSLADSGKIQEIFLNHCRKNRIKVSLKGSRSSFEGYIAGFDQETIIVEKNNQQLLFYKSGIHSIHPCEEVNFIFNDSWKAKGPQYAYQTRSYVN